MVPEQGKKGRDARRMARFPCNGLLYVTPRDGFIQCMVKHSLDHVPYKEISIPEEWRQYITDNHNIGAVKVRVPCFIQSVLTKKLVKIWSDILHLTGGGEGIAFTQRAVHYAWMRKSSQLWRCADNPIESAHKWCQMYGAQEHIEMPEMVPVPHSKAFAFVVKDFMDVWACHTDSFLVDSTCKFFNVLEFQC